MSLPSASFETGAACCVKSAKTVAPTLKVGVKGASSAIAETEIARSAIALRVIRMGSFLSISRPRVCRRPCMLERVRRAVERLGMAEKKETGGRQMTRQPAHDSGFRFPVEVDEHIAAEDEIERAVDGILFFVEIDAPELNERADVGLRANFSFFTPHAAQHVGAE